MEEIELFIRNEKEDGVFAVSLVENPAIEENFVALSQQEIELKVADEERRVVVGVALVPQKRIYRKMKDKEFNIYFSKETIAKAQELYMRNLNANNVTSEHEKPVKGATVIESWIVENEKNDKSNIYKLNAPAGSWVIMMKIYNDEEWKLIKEGEYKGFSIEGMFQGFEELEASAQLSDDEKLLEEIRDIIKNTTYLSEEVQLSLANEAKKLISQSDANLKILENTEKAYNDALKKKESLQTKVIGLMGKIENTAKELGLNFKDVSEYIELKDILDRWNKF